MTQENIELKVDVRDLMYFFNEIIPSELTDSELNILYSTAGNQYHDAEMEMRQRKQSREEI